MEATLIMPIFFFILIWEFDEMELWRNTSMLSECWAKLNMFMSNLKPDLTVSSLYKVTCAPRRLRRSIWDKSQLKYEAISAMRWKVKRSWKLLISFELSLSLGALSRDDADVLSGEGAYPRPTQTQYTWGRQLALNLLVARLTPQVCLLHLSTEETMLKKKRRDARRARHQSLAGMLSPRWSPARRRVLCLRAGYETSPVQMRIQNGHPPARLCLMTPLQPFPNHISSPLPFLN